MIRKFKYNGRLASGECAPRHGRPFEFSHGASVEVSERVAKELAESADWEEIKSKKSKQSGADDAKEG